MRTIKIILSFLVTVYLLKCYVNNSDTKISGQDIYFKNCQNCHSSSRAPNLTAYKIELSQIIDKVKYGGSGMPSFDQFLSEKEILDVANYIINEL